MYKVVNIADLNLATNFIETDKVIEIDGSQTKMKIAENDYAHKSKSYLSNAINIVDSAFNSYLQAIDNIYTTYLTSDISSVYLPNGSAIKMQTLETILSSDAFLTKDGCKKIETDCIAYINELKNKAISIIMAQLNKSFILQNSAGKLAYGQKFSGSSYDIDYIMDITENGFPTTNDYNFETGEFSFAQLLFGIDANKDYVPEPSNGDSTENNAITPTSADTIKPSVPDAWKDFYREFRKTYVLSGDVEELLSHELSSYIVFNGNNDKSDYKIIVPQNSFDYEKNETIPIAQLINGILKHQIKTVIKNVCDKYISKMTSVPTKVALNVSEN